MHIHEKMQVDGALFKTGYFELLLLSSVYLTLVSITDPPQAILRSTSADRIGS